MIDGLPVWMGDIHKTVPASLCGVIVATVSVLCGAAVGTERERRQKPAGLRTMILICLGAAIFTQASLLLALPTSDPARIAAQVVTGVGFLGAGAIIHGRGGISGFTTGAAIWVVAAIGVVIGGGYVFAGAFFTTLSVFTLAAERMIESLIFGPCRWSELNIEFDDASGKTRWLIQEILDDHQVPDTLAHFGVTTDGIGTLTIRCCRRHRQHRSFLSAIARLAAVQTINETT